MLDEHTKCINVMNVARFCLHVSILQAAGVHSRQLYLGIQFQQSGAALIIVRTFLIPNIDYVLVLRNLILSCEYERLSEHGLR